MSIRPYDIGERSFELACEVLAFCRNLVRHDAVLRVVGVQVTRAATAVGSNLAEATDAESRRDFIHKACIALKECRESSYRLKLIAASAPFDAETLARLRQESEELPRILRTIVLNAKRRRSATGSRSTQAPTL